MTVWGYLVWGGAIAIATIPIIGLLAELLDWYKERGDHGGE